MQHCRRHKTQSPGPLHASSESGQTIVLLALFLTALLGVAGLAIDAGNLLVQRRAVQNAADAAALAGASTLPGGSMNALNNARTEYANNGLSTDSPSFANTTDMTPNDSITVTTTRQVHTFFAGILGIDNVAVSATARATIESYSQVQGTYAMPWGVLKGSYVPGQPYAIYTKANTGSGNNGALSLPYVSGSNCPDPNGANAYQNEINGTLPACPITIGEQIDTKTGDNSGPTAQGLNARITNWQTFDQIVQANSDGTYTVIQSNSPQLVLIPVLTNPAGVSSWPSGSSAPMTVVGFAWFVITSCGDPQHPTYCSNSDGKQVNGTFVGLDSDTSTGTSGQYDPSSNTAYTAALTQ